nr:GNAT family N-acetyltransferase [Candidatus Cloacimonadota bacterium]
MKLLQDYCEDPSKRYLLNNFSKKVFNLDFSKWEGNGFWDSAYKPISLLDNGEIISNVSIYSLEMIINGKKCKVAQLSTVGTLPEYRKKGFGNKLINEAIKILEKNHELIFLFADEDAVEFYQTLGFSFKMESKYVARIPKYQRKKGLQQLDMKNKTDLMKLHKYAQKRISVSDVIGIFNENLLMFHGLYTLTEHIYFIPDLDIIIIYKIKENKLVLFDIIG